METLATSEQLPDLPVPEMPVGEKGWYVFGGYLLIRYILIPLFRRLTPRRSKAPAAIPPDTEER